MTPLLPSKRMVALLLLAVLGSVPACLTNAHAQDAETLLSARVCESETRPADSNAERASECIQIVAATAERAVLHGRSYLAELRSYSPRATGRSYPGREHITTMHPHRLPEVAGMNRELARVRFAVLVTAAWRGLHGAEPPCPSALEWGAPGCAACVRRMRAAGYRRVDGCGSNWWFSPGGV